MFFSEKNILLCCLTESMKEARFISRNKDKWKNMENGQQPDAEHLAANFIELSDDLAYARTFYPGSEVERYLNQLIAGYQTDINSRPVRKNKPIWYFWKQELPLLLASEYKTLLFAFFFFVHEVIFVLRLSRNYYCLYKSPHFKFGLKGKDTS